MSHTGKLVERNGKRVWHLLNAEGQILGRLATQISHVLMGKHKPTYLSHDPGCGDYVVVINASKIAYSNKTYEKKLYRWHTGWPGGLKERTLQEMEKRNPEKILWKAVYGMLPKNRLRQEQIQRLRIFLDDENENIAQTSSQGSNWPVFKMRHFWDKDADKALLSPAIEEFPDDFGHVLFDWNNFEPGYKDPYDVDFKQLHEMYLKVHPEVRAKEEEKLAEFKKVEEYIKKSVNMSDEQAAEVAKPLLEEAIDIEKLVRKE